MHLVYPKKPERCGGMIIYLARALLHGSSELPVPRPGRSRGSDLALAPERVYHALLSPAAEKRSSRLASNHIVSLFTFCQHSAQGIPSYGPIRHLAFVICNSQREALTSIVSVAMRIPKDPHHPFEGTLSLGLRKGFGRISPI